MEDRKKERVRNPGFRRLETLYTDLVGKLEDLSRDEYLFRRRPAARGKDPAGPAEIVTEGSDLEQVRLWALILQETDKLRRSLYALPTWEAREKIAVERAKLDLMARKLEGASLPGIGVVELPQVLPEEPDVPAMEV